MGMKSLAWLFKDPRRFFFPIFDYSISEYLGEGEKKLTKLGFKVAFLGDLADKEFEERNGKFYWEDGRKVSEDVAKLIRKLGFEETFPVQAHYLMKTEKKLVFVYFGESVVPEIARELGFDVDCMDYYKLVSRTEAGLVPVVHRYLALRGCPHPFLDKIAFDMIDDYKPALRMEELDEILMSHVIRFSRIFSRWSQLVEDMRRMALFLESKLSSEGGTREIYALSRIMGFDMDVHELTGSIQELISLPRRPDLKVCILRKH